MKNAVKILLVILCFSLVGCKWFSGAGRTFSSMTKFKIPDGTPLFQKGFRDGCGNAFYARGNGFYRTRFEYRFDGNLAGNGEYRFGISRGYSYCFAYGVGGATGGPHASFDRFLSPHGYDTTYNAASVGDAWGGFFGGGDQWKAGISYGSVDDVFNVYQTGIGGEGTAFGTSGNGIIWASGSRGQFFGQ